MLYRGKRREVRHETLLDFRGAGAVHRRVFSPDSDHRDVRISGSAQPVRTGEAVRGVLKTLQYSYLFGILPVLMIAAVDDIFFHVKRIGPVVRMLGVGVIAFFAAELLYGSRGADTGTAQFILYGLVGFVPATVSSWLAHEAIDAARRPPCLITARNLGSYACGRVTQLAFASGVTI